MWASQLSRYTSCRIAGESLTITDFIKDVLRKQRSCLHVVQAWRVTDKANNAAVTHHWMILRVRQLWNTDDTFIAIHRLDTRDYVEFYESLNEAIWDNQWRKPTNPVATVEFETAGKRPLMLDYLFPMLESMVIERYQLVTNNCQHFAADILKTILKAGFYLETCKEWNPVCELEFQNKKEHRQKKRLTKTQATQMLESKWLPLAAYRVSSMSLLRKTLAVMLPVPLIKAGFEVIEYQKAEKLIWIPIDNDYKVNMHRWACY